MSKMLGHFPPHEPLDKGETEGGVTAFAALMYQESVKMNAWALIGMWGLGIGSYRVMKYIDQKKELDERRKKTLTAAEMQSKLEAERERLNQVAGTGESNNGRPQPGVVSGVSAVRAQPAAPNGEKPSLTAEQALSIVKFPGEPN